MREEKVEVKSRWQHFKGDIMEVEFVALHTETLEEYLIYFYNIYR